MLRCHSGKTNHTEACETSFGSQIANIAGMLTARHCPTLWPRAVLKIGFAVTSAVLVGRVQSQTKPATRDELRFDVASVRPNHKAACRGRWDFTASHGVVTAENAPLLRIVSRAYNLTDDRVLAPSWIKSECYDIRAKTSRSNLPEPDLMTMLQELLKERFHLVGRRESDERAIFALLPDKNGVKMPADGSPIPSPPSITDGRVLFMGKTLHDLCERLGTATGRPVIDKTGLDGKYVIVLTYLPLGSTNVDLSDTASDIFTAVRDQLGLRLESQRGLVDTLKVDAIDKVPTDN